MESMKKQIGEVSMTEFNINFKKIMFINSNEP